LDTGSLRLRPNPHYSLRGFGELTAAERDSLGQFIGDPSIWGVLIPVRGGLQTIKLVGRDVARLYRRLGDNDRLPSGLLGAITDEEILDLVGAEILEIEIAGRFVTGIEALSHLQRDETPSASGRLASLSLDAIAYAASLQLDDQGAVADRLYSYNRIAVRESWRTPEAEATLRQKIANAIPANLTDDGAWVQTAALPWKNFRRPNRLPPSGKPTYKLYVSPTIDPLADALYLGVQLSTQNHGVLGWKVANCIDTAVRPDKYVLYVESRQVLTALAAELSSALTGIASHGVPFTCEAGLDGLLSWGIDPPVPAHSTTGLADSWRTWITTRLASGIVQARRAGLPAPRAQLAALHCARAVGVDTTSWAPTPALLSNLDDGPP
jgi:hypothetical protein